MNRQEVLASFDRQQRIEIEFPDMRKEVTPHVTRFLRPAPGMSLILHGRLDAGNADAVIREQVEYFTRQGLAFTWKAFEHDSPPDLADRLVRAGFAADTPEGVMVLDLSSLPPSLAQPPSAGVRRIETREGLGDVIRVMEQVWGGSFAWMWDRLGGHLAVPGYLSIYVAYVHDEPACSGWIYFNLKGNFAGLWGGSTVPALRGHGLYRAVLAARVQEAAARGYHYITLDAGEMSAPIVLRHGFELLTVAHTCDWTRSARNA
jgi:hypothetical protein